MADCSAELRYPSDPPGSALLRRSDADGFTPATRQIRVASCNFFSRPATEGSRMTSVLDLPVAAQYYPERRFRAASEPTSHISTATADDCSYARCRPVAGRWNKRPGQKPRQTGARDLSERATGEIGAPCPGGAVRRWRQGFPTRSSWSCGWPLKFRRPQFRPNVLPVVRAQVLLRVTAPPVARLIATHRSIGIGFQPTDPMIDFGGDAQIALASVICEPAT